MQPIRVLKIGGTPYDMGFQHGLAFADEIRTLTNERVHLSMSKDWTGRSLARRDVLAIAQHMIDDHGNYAPDLLEELEGIGAATGLTLPELVVANGFTDFIDVIYNHGDKVYAPALFGAECTTFMANPNANIAEHGLIGQTWDMHSTATPHVIMLDGKPKNAPEFLMFTLTGCVGMIGMNSAGISVAINNLEGADGKPGVTWNFVVRKVLAQDNLEDALKCITEANLAGAHNYMLMDTHGRGYNVEAMSSVKHVEAIQDTTYAHANICLNDDTRSVEREQTDQWLVDSQMRVDRASELLEELRPITPDDLMTITRDRSHGEYSICALPEAPHYWETSGAVVMRPHSKEFWAVWGLPIENEYQRFTF